MLARKELEKLREHIERAQQPIFLFDNDVDGLCSYILLRRFLGRGKGVAVKSHPNIDVGYAKKVQELRGDAVVVLDRPYLGKDFVHEIAQFNLPIIWIDHHDIIPEIYNYELIYHFNPTIKKNKSVEPTTYLCYKTTGRAEDSWLAMIGCIADHYLPDFVDEFSKRYRELWGKNIAKPFEALYTTGIGRLARALSFGLKDSTTHVVALQNFLISCAGPYDVEQELERPSAFGTRYKEILKKYTELLEEAKRSAGEKIVIFNYGGQLSISSDLSNELSYLFSKHYICVAYSAGPITNVSLRGKNVKKILSDLLPLFPGATGGGHQDAVGARIQTSYWERFKEELLKLIKK